LLRANGEQNLTRAVSFGGQGLIGRALEVVKRPWKIGRFDGPRTVFKYLVDQMYVIHVTHPRS
jgi:hypothetical protein